MDFTITASFDTAGMTMMGISPASMATSTLGFSPAPHGVGCNCGVGASAPSGCPAGTYMQGGACVTCPVGSYCNSLSPQPVRTQPVVGKLLRARG